MIDVFIGYGGPRAQTVANDLGNFLRTEEMNVFLATPASPSLRPTAEWRIEIDKSLLNCNVAIFVCHQGTPRSPEIRREIKFLFDSGQEQKIISFTTHKDCIPRLLRDRWNPFHFPPEKPEESFCRLLNQIFRCYIRNSIQVNLIPENENERRD